MASWSEFESAAPEMAAIGRALLERHQLAYLATVRADGAPRVHPVSPLIAAGRLVIATPRSSPKGRDQLRDGRYMLHFLPGDDDREFSVRGRATPVTDARVRADAKAQAHYVRDEDHLFEYDIAEAATAYWVNVGQPGTYAVRDRWRDA